VYKGTTDVAFERCSIYISTAYRKTKYIQLHNAVENDYKRVTFARYSVWCALSHSRKS